MKFNHLNVPTHWQNYWTRYPEGHTILEALISWVSQVDSMVDNQNKLNTNVEQFRTEIDEFVGRFDDRLQDEVTQTLQDWQGSGFLDVVISEALQWQLDNYIATNEQDKLSLTAQLQQKVSNNDLDNVMIRALSEGIVLDDETAATTNTQILNDLLGVIDTPLYLPAGTIFINNTLVMTENSKIYGNPNAHIWQLNLNADAIKLNRRVVLEDFKITLSTGHVKSGLLLDGSLDVRESKIKNVKIQCLNEDGFTYTSTGVKMTALPKGTQLAFNIFENMSIHKAKYAIYLEDDQAAGNGWINATRFRNIHIDGAIYGVYVKGNPSGNEFNFQFQTSQPTLEAVHCEGHNNSFSGFIWDISLFSANAKTVVLTKKSKQNTIDFPPVNQDKHYMIDVGVDNMFKNYSESVNPNLKPINAIANYTLFDDSFQINRPTFFGLQDNCLAFIDKVATVTVNGNVVYNPGVSHLFNSKNTDEFFFGDPSVTPASIEIVLGSTFIDDLSILGMSFSNGRIPSDYSIEVATTSTGSYSKLVDVKGNTQSSIIHQLTRFGVDAYKIRITFTKAIANASANPDNSIRLSSIYGVNNGRHFSSPYLNREGGTVYGDLHIVSSKALILTAPDGNKYKVMVGTDGVLTTHLIP